MNLGETRGIDMSINLSSSDVGMTKQFLNSTDIRSMLKHVGSVRMTKHMRRNTLSLNTNVRSALFDELENPLPRERTATPSQKYYAWLIPFDKATARFVKVFDKRPARRAADRHQSSLGTFTGQSQQFTIADDVLSSKATRFADTQATAIKDFQ